MKKVPARNHNRDMTIERAKLVVENAPNYDRDVLIAYVRDALQDACDEGKRLGAMEARETLLRSELAFHEGNATRAIGDANATRNELNELLKSLGKSHVFPPEFRAVIK